MNLAEYQELETFLLQYPDTTMLELMAPDLNGILRGKRIPASEFATLYRQGVKHPAALTLLNSIGDMIEDVPGYEGDPDKLMRAIAGTLAPVPWLNSDTGQVLATFTELDGAPGLFDTRNILVNALGPVWSMGLSVVVAVEMEFYLVEEGEGRLPTPHLPRLPGTSLPQEGVQYAMAEDLWDQDAFLEDVRETCLLQGVPMTTVHSEFSPGQYEINLRHCADPLLACDHALMLKRIVKGVARKHGMYATFMAKPFDGLAGSGMHMHVSLYDESGENVFADGNTNTAPAISETLRHAVGGMALTMQAATAVFAPNANSYRRMVPGSFVPLAPTWGYNHRDVALRIPVSDHKDTRIEHRVAGADANPYLVLAAIIAGMHYGITERCEPPEMINEGETLEPVFTLPRLWQQALDQFADSEVLARYLTPEFCELFKSIRQTECDRFAAQVSNRDYEWYLRSV
ncbi:MAG: glutamine synthetase family protein [Pseudomonadota bacterium]